MPPDPLSGASSKSSDSLALTESEVASLIPKYLVIAVDFTEPNLLVHIFSRVGFRFGPSPAMSLLYPGPVRASASGPQRVGRSGLVTSMPCLPMTDSWMSPLHPPLTFWPHLFLFIYFFVV